MEDEGTLQEAVLWSLHRLQKEFDADGLPSPYDLWNDPVPSRKLSARPRKEEDLSKLLRRWLQKDLPAKSGIIVNCEVKVERFGKGKLDLKIEALSKSSIPRRITVIIEVKRCNHAEVATACGDQLADGYLREQGLTHGIYLVGWFGSKKGPARNWKNRNVAIEGVQAWATAASKENLKIKGFLLDCQVPELVAPSQRAC